MDEHIIIKQMICAARDGEVTSDDKRQIDAHLKTCASCRQYAQELSSLSGILKTCDDENLSPDLEYRIQRKIKEAKMNEQTIKSSNTRFMKISVSAGALVMVVMLFVSVQVYFKSGIQGNVRIAQLNTPVSTAVDKNRVAMSTPPKPSAQAEVEISELAALAPAVGERNEIALLKEKSQSGFSRVDSIQGQYEPYYLGAHQSVSDFQVASGKVIAPFEGSGMIQDGISLGDEIYQIYPPVYPQRDEQFSTEDYNRIYENAFLEVTQNPLSTFSIDVDTASYSNARRFLNNGQMPPEDAVRVEEMVNYFTYDYPQPQNDDPFSITTQATACPWNPDHQLLQIGLRGKVLNPDQMPESNLVFLIDVSGSMNDPNKLPLLKSAFKILVNQLDAKQRVAMVVYAGAAGKVLDSTVGTDKLKILNALEGLSAGGSTAGGEGIKLAYQIAKDNLIAGGNNRVILASDGDFNVGISSDGELTRLIEEKRKEGVFLTVLGFGTGNTKDNKMEQLADKGNGNYYYIDTLNEARKVLVQELGSTLFTIAKDVKLQIEFNPAQVKAYRLLGYENRVLAKEDFNDDAKDAGELGAGHTVTAFYEIVPAGSNETFGQVDQLQYQKTEIAPSDDMMTVKLRYKKPSEETSQLLAKTLNVKDLTAQPTGDFQFASAVAEFGLLLRNSQFKAKASYDHVLDSARASKGTDTFGYRQEFIDLVQKAKGLDTRSTTPGVIFKGQ